MFYGVAGHFLRFPSKERELEGLRCVEIGAIYKREEEVIGKGNSASLHRVPSSMAPSLPLPILIRNRPVSQQPLSCCLSEMSYGNAVLVSC